MESSLRWVITGGQTAKGRIHTGPSMNFDKIHSKEIFSRDLICIRSTTLTLLIQKFWTYEVTWKNFLECILSKFKIEGPV